ncbi:hypothetical protein D9613_001356 [Agrocybe pediades]|uniref:Uncharacterized protein n=1 Tax=Agrocybe pediades TaxID=84607 RepID=A0A8H4R5H3_9AGAR|nr:hypothetical protein D9613_001356 [Agrocybe pediades]
MAQSINPLSGSSRNQESMMPRSQPSVTLTENLLWSSPAMREGYRPEIKTSGIVEAIPPPGPNNAGASGSAGGQGAVNNHQSWWSGFVTAGKTLCRRLRGAMRRRAPNPHPRPPLIVNMTVASHTRVIEVIERYD